MNENCVCFDSKFGHYNRNLIWVAFLVYVHTKLVRKIDFISLLNILYPQENRSVCSLYVDFFLRTTMILANMKPYSHCCIQWFSYKLTKKNMNKFNPTVCLLTLQFSSQLLTILRNLSVQMWCFFIGEERVRENNCITNTDPFVFISRIAYAQFVKREWYTGGSCIW